jgi:NAD(P)-dependent dehydrogenase (short-subunit alcohol dehydrogenase family)
MEISLSGRAVVTGAATGIGRASAELLREAGADVVAVDRNAEALAALVGMDTMCVDLADADQRAELIDGCKGARYLVNAAGMMRMKDIFDFTAQDIRDIYAVNVEAVWELTSGLGRHMPEGGAIVNLSSVSARLPTTLETAVYASSKAAVVSLTRSFAYALAPRKVRVNAILPGIINTEMQDQVLSELARLRGTTVEEIARRRLEMVPLGREAAPAECAALICFLLSDTASYLTGQAIVQDGGIVTG